MNSEEIARRAYEIYEREGRQDGKDFEHWMRAETELREQTNGASKPANAAGSNSSPAPAAINGQNRVEPNTQGDGKGKGNGNGNGKKANRPAATASRN